MDSDFSTNYDAIVVGTGLTESILAAALSRIGKTVLHLDENEYYGGLWGSFNFVGLQSWVETCKRQENKTEIDKTSIELNKGETLVELSDRSPSVWNLKENWLGESKHLVSDESEVETSVEENRERWTLEKLTEESKHFNLDLAPKLLFSRGDMVELLIQSNITRYAEFKSVTRVLTWREGKLEPVPCSRADVFATKNVSVVQKRMLVKLLTFCSLYPDNADLLAGFENKTFLEFLKFKKVPDNVIHYILYAISMSTDSTSCVDGILSTKSFLSSLGRYGNTPFLFQLYGSGEMPQCFCRLCAVYGGTYWLKRGIDGLIVDRDNVCTGVLSNNQVLRSKHVIMSSYYLPKQYLTLTNNANVSRGIYLSKKSILETDRHEITLLKYPPVENSFRNTVTVLEADWSTHVCPRGIYTCHMTTETVTDAESDLKHVVDSLYDESNDLLWSLTWNMSQGQSETSESCPRNVIACSGPDLRLDYDRAVQEARRLFAQIYPDEEFLPRAHDPEEIIFDYEDTKIDEGNNLEEENKDEGVENLVEGKENQTGGKEDKTEGKDDKTEGKEDKTEGKEDKTKGKEDKTKGKEDKTEGKEDKTEGKEDKTRGMEDKTEGKEDKTEGKEDKTRGMEGKTEGKEDKTEGKEDTTEDVFEENYDIEVNINSSV